MKQPTRDLTDREFRVLSSPAVVTAMAKRVDELIRSGVDQEEALLTVALEAEEELARQERSRLLSRTQKVKFGASMGEVLQSKRK